jgi:AcrR family transcriptional regulator
MKKSEQTKERIIDAVGQIITIEGPEELKIARIARKAGVDRKIVYQYFGRDTWNIVEAYLQKKDFWLRSPSPLANPQVMLTSEVRDLVTTILQNHWEYFSNDADVQKLILWELNGTAEKFRSIHNAREVRAETILEHVEQHFAHSGIKFGPIAVLILGGIYYANLHALHNGSKICGIDIKSPEGQAEIAAAIGQLLTWAFDAAGKKSN